MHNSIILPKIKIILYLNKALPSSTSRRNIWRKPQVRRATAALRLFCRQMQENSLLKRYFCFIFQLQIKFYCCPEECMWNVHSVHIIDRRMLTRKSEEADDSRAKSNFFSISFYPLTKDSRVVFYSFGSSRRLNDCKTSNVSSYTLVNFHGDNNEPFEQ